VTVSGPPPDLVETVVSTAATVLTPGATFNVTDTVVNHGASATGFVVAFHLSLDGAYGGADDVALAATRSVSALGASASSTATTKLQVPASAPAGNYHVCAMADALNAVVESVESNNTLCTSSSISITRPDLAFKQLQPGASSVRAGGSLSVTDSVQNISLVASPSFKVGYHLSVNQIYGDGDDVAIAATRSVASLAAGAVNQGTAKLKIPNVAPGAYYVCAKDDSGGAITELDEGNNTGCSATKVQVGR
jgi:subtilase family serine protease